MNLKGLLDLHLGRGQEYYVNTAEEAALLDSFAELLSVSKASRNLDPKANPAKLEKLRKAYEGVLKGLNVETGEETPLRFKSLKQMGFELIEAQVNNITPSPKMQVKYKKDIVNVRSTETYLKYLMDKALTERINDRSERSRKVDGTFFYKIIFTPKGEISFNGYLADQVTPQPGLINFYDSKYVFVEETMTLYDLYKVYGRKIMPSQSKDTPTKTSLTNAEVASCYYINDKGTVGLFMWAPQTNQVIFNEYEWQVRRYRTCTHCDNIVHTGDECDVCHKRNFKYVTAENEVLEEAIAEVYNPYDVGESEDADAAPVLNILADVGTEIPHYKVTRLPFVISTNITSMKSMYGISDMAIILEMQDSANKVLTRVEEKLLSTTSIEFTPQRVNIQDDNAVVKRVKIRTEAERRMSGLENFNIEVYNDLTYVNMIYDNARSALGITEAYQGKRDTTAESGRAKEVSASQAAGRLQSKDIMKSTSYAELYELMFQYLLAFSDKPVTYVTKNADGEEVEQEWSKHMFLDTDESGNLYYRDDYSFSVDETAALTKDRPTMWQLIKQDFINGSLGNPSDPKVVKLFWNLLDIQQYPIAPEALASVKENEKRLPFEMEQEIMNNPELQQLIAAAMASKGSSGVGGGRPQKRTEVGSVTGATHSKNMEKTNERNRLNSGGV